LYCRSPQLGAAQVFGQRADTSPAKPRRLTLPFQAFLDARVLLPLGRYSPSWVSGLVAADTRAVLASATMEELIFVVEEAPEGGYTARALGASIFTEAATVEELHDEVRDAVRCHFDDGKAPKIIRLHFVHDEVISA